jgi:hypothetical protein
MNNSSGLSGLKTILDAVSCTILCQYIPKIFNLPHFSFWLFLLLAFPLILFLNAQFRKSDVKTNKKLTKAGIGMLITFLCLFVGLSVAFVLNAKEYLYSIFIAVSIVWLNFRTTLLFIRKSKEWVSE